MILIRNLVEDFIFNQFSDKLVKLSIELVKISKTKITNTNQLTFMRVRNIGCKSHVTYGKLWCKTNLGAILIIVIFSLSYAHATSDLCVAQKTRDKARLTPLPSGLCLCSTAKVLIFRRAWYDAIFLANRK